MPTVDVYISGRDYILKADLTGGTTYLPVAALTTSEFSSKNPSIDATSKEGNLHQYSPYYDQSFKCEGFAITQTGTVSKTCLLYTSPSPRDRQKSRMPSSA